MSADWLPRVIGLALKSRKGKCSDKFVSYSWQRTTKDDGLINNRCNTRNRHQRPDVLPLGVLYNSCKRSPVKSVCGNSCSSHLLGRWNDISNRVDKCNVNYKPRLQSLFVLGGFDATLQNKLCKSCHMMNSDAFPETTDCSIGEDNIYSCFNAHRRTLAHKRNCLIYFVWFRTLLESLQNVDNRNDCPFYLLLFFFQEQHHFEQNQVLLRNYSTIFL